jgi:CHAT domain-containing protein
VCLWAIGSASPASAAGDRCTPAATHTPEPSTAAEAALARGNRLYADDAREAAQTAWHEAASLARAANEPAVVALARANAGRAAADTGRPRDATTALEEALTIGEALENARLRAALLADVGRSYARVARDTDDPESLKRAAEILRAASDAAAADSVTRSMALGTLGALYEYEGHVDDALQLTRRALFAALDADAPEAIYPWQWQIARLERGAGRDDVALDTYRQAVRTLADVRPTAALGSDARASRFRARVEPLYLELVDLLLSGVEAADAAEQQALLLEARGALEDLKAAELRDYFDDPCLDAQRKASPESIPGAVVVYPILLADRLELVIGREGRLERRSVPVPRDRVIEEVRALRFRLERVTTRQYLRHAQHLYDWLARPVLEAVPEGAMEVLVVVPGGALRTIPFGALSDPDTGRFLIEQVPVAVVPSLSLTDPRPIDREGVRLLAAGISQAVQGYPPLANVPVEMRALERAFGGTELLDEEFAVARFESEVAGKPYGIVHVASHGEFFANPDDSFVLAWDGRISIDRLAAVVGTTQFRGEQPLELLTLSACETAAGDDRAALGLAGVAVRAGARSALASLWAVHDEASARLVTDFYRELSTPDTSRAAALRTAQLALLETRHFRHPGYWAPFLLINSWL